MIRICHIPGYLGNASLNDSSKAARRRPLNGGRGKMRVMVGSWRMKADNWQPSGDSRLVYSNHGAVT
jgi:hypothetical protein